MQMAKKNQIVKLAPLAVGAVLVLLVLVFVGILPTFSADEPKGDYIRIDGGEPYLITNAYSLVDANLALMEWRAKGSANDNAVYGVLEGESVSGFEQTYNKIYDMLLGLYDTQSDKSVLYYDISANNTPSGSYIVTTCPTNSTSTSTVLWKISGTVTLTAEKKMAKTGRVLIISEDSATIELTDALSRFSLSDTSTLTIQGRNSQKNITVTSESSTRKSGDKYYPAIDVTGGSLYLQYCNLDGFEYPTESVSMVRFPEGKQARYLYMSDSFLQNVKGTEAPGIFCKVYSSAADSIADQSKLYINYCLFQNCVTNSGSTDTVGGSAIIDV